MQMSTASSGPAHRTAQLIDLIVKDAPTDLADATADEEILVQRAMAHDSQAFACLYDRYVGKIYRYFAYRMTAKAQAEDLTALVFLKSWEAIGNYRLTGRPFAAWLYRIAHNVAVDYYRRWHESVSFDDTSFAEPPVDVEDMTTREMATQDLRDAIARLTPNQQQVIILRFVEDLTTEQVAKIVRRTPGAVRTLQHRAIVKLGRILRADEDARIRSNRNDTLEEY